MSDHKNYHLLFDGKDKGVSVAKLTNDEGEPAIRFCFYDDEGDEQIIELEFGNKKERNKTWKKMDAASTADYLNLFCKSSVRVPD